MGFLTELLTKYNMVKVGTVIQPRRSTLNIIGGIVTDDPANDATNITVGGSSSGGFTETTLAFTQPGVNSAVNVSVASTVGLQPGQSIAIGGGGYYINQSTVDATHLLLINTGSAVNQAPLGTVASNELVSIAGQGAPLAAQARGNGQALLLSAGTDTPSGLAIVRNVLAYDSTLAPGGLLTVGMKAALADTTTHPEAVYVPEGRFFIQEPILLPDGTTLRGAGHAPNNAGNATTLIGPTTGTRYTGFFIGPNIAIVPPTQALAPQYVLRNGLYWLQWPGVTLGSPVIALSMYETGSINALAAMTVEAHLNYNSSNNGTSVLFQSSGARTHSSALATALQVHISGASSPYNTQAGVTTSVTGLVTLTNNAVLAGNTDTAIALDYDGAHARLYIGGNVQATTAACTGTIVQNWYETHCIGASVQAGGYPLTFSTLLGASQLASYRLSKIARYAGSNYSVPSTQYAYDTNILMIGNFDPAYRFVGYWLVFMGNHPTLGFAEIFYPLLNICATTSENNGNIIIEDMGLSTYGMNIYTESSQICSYRRLQLSGVQGITTTNNCFYSQYEDLDMHITGRLAANSRSMSWGIGMLGVCGLSTLYNVNFQSCVGDFGFVLTSSGQVHMNKCVINVIAGQGGYYISGGTGMVFNNGGSGDEGGTIGWANMILDRVLTYHSTGFGASNATGGAGSSCYVIDGGNDIAIDSDDAISAGSGNPIVTFLSTPTDIDGTITPVRHLTRQQGQGLGVSKVPWTDGTGPMIIAPQEIFGNGPIVFPSDANYTPPWNASAWGHLTVDTTACTATRNLVLPRNTGKRYQVQVTGGHSVQFIGPSGTGITVASGLLSAAGTAIRDDGTNIDEA